MWIVSVFFIFSSSFASACVNSTLATNTFDVPFVKGNTQRRSMVSFVVGQPFGYLSSWPLFALAEVARKQQREDDVLGRVRLYVTLIEMSTIEHRCHSVVGKIWDDPLGARHASLRLHYGAPLCLPSVFYRALGIHAISMSQRNTRHILVLPSVFWARHSANLNEKFVIVCS